MTFNFTPKCDGKPLPMQVPFTGSRQEAYEKALELAKAMGKLFKHHKFTIRLDRTDAQADGYQIDEHGHTV